MTAFPFKAPRTAEWTRERLEKLGKQDLLNLRDNAERLGEPELAALCGELAKKRPLTGPKSIGAAARPKAKSPNKLLSREKAFGTRGVWLSDPRASWSGVRKSDGAVVMALWHAAVRTSKGACACLLWAPNTDGARPWSDSVAGRERLEHCKLAMEKDGAEGLLVHGETLEGRLPEDRAHTILGVDAETVIRFQVELRGEEYWASWGKKAAKA